MTTDEVKRGGQAVAAVRERYEIAGTLNRDTGFGPPYGPWGVVEKVGETYVIHLREVHTRGECQAWIDEQAARAVIESLLPASQAVAREAIEAAGLVAVANIWARQIIDCYLHHIVGDA